jgi:signal transduction histidine kinase
MRITFAGLFVMAFTWLNVQGAEPRRVLLLHSFGREFEPFITFSETFRSELARQSPDPLDFFDVALGSVRFEGSEEAPFVDYLLALFAGHRVDLVVPMGGPACQFAQKYRARLFPDTPMLLAAVEQRMFQSSMFKTNDAVLSVRHDPQLVVEAILRLLPATTNVVVVFGNSPLEKFWTEEFQRAIQSIAPPVSVESFNKLPFTQMKERAATLPPHSVMIYGQVLVDADGVPQTEEHALRNLHAVANAPMFGIHDFQLGRGIVGGPLMSVRELSHRSASAAARILGGEAPANFRPPPFSYGPPTYDWRELRRWRISESRLPAGAVIRFQEPSFWQLYRWRIVIAGGVIASQTALIASLLLQRRRRHQAELQAQLGRAELARASLLATAGELTSSISHELNQPLGAILRNAEAAQKILQRSSPDLEELRAIVGDIRADDRRASDVISHLRALLKRHALETQPIGVPELVDDVAVLVRSEASKRSIRLETEVPPDLPRVQGDRVYLQQVLLNLVLNGMDALGNGTSDPRRVTVRARRDAQRKIEVSVSDTGYGIPAEKLERVFEPFFTTKPNGMGLGLSVSRTLIEAHGGRIWAENNMERGTTFRFTLKIGEEKAGK